MKTIELTKNELVSGKKVFIGSKSISEPETWEEFIQLINGEKLTAMADWKSGRRVRVQREIKGSESKVDKLDKIAQGLGFDTFNEMVESAKLNKSAE